MARQSRWLLTSKGHCCRQRSQSALAGTRSSLMFWVRCSSTAARSASDQGRFRTPRFPAVNKRGTELEVKWFFRARTLNQNLWLNWRKYRAESVYISVFLTFLFHVSIKTEVQSDKDKDLVMKLRKIHRFLNYMTKSKLNTTVNLLPVQLNYNVL